MIINVKDTIKYSDMFVLEEKKKTNISVAANNVAELTIDISKEGYKCIGIVGVIINNSSSQTGAANIITRSFNVGTNNECYISVRNVSSTARTVDVGVQCLYVKE